MWLLAALAWIAIVAGIFWQYGSKRRRAASAREKELAALMIEARLKVQAAKNPVEATAPAGSPSPAAMPVPVAGNLHQRKARLLGQADALLYLLFRTGLPDHEVFANLSLADVVEPAPAVRGYEREQLTRKLAQQRLNMVVCNKQLEIIAVVLVDANELLSDGSYVKTCLQAAGIRLLNIDSAAMPRYQQIRTLVYGEGAPGAT